MIDIRIVKEQYRGMPDDVLISFAKNEVEKLSIEAFHQLKSEFEERHLDLGILDEAQTDKDLAEATKISEFEKATAVEYTETIWKFAFDEKANGKSYEEIFKALIQKNISQEYAYMLIESIEPRAKELVDSFDTDIIIGWILSIIGALLLFYTLNSTTQASFLIWGTMLLLGGIVRLVTSYKNKRKFQTIVSNIAAEKERHNSLYQ